MVLAYKQSASEQSRFAVMSKALSLASVYLVYIHTVISQALRNDFIFSDLNLNVS